MSSRICQSKQHSLHGLLEKDGRKRRPKPKKLQSSGSSSSGETLTTCTYTDSFTSLSSRDDVTLTVAKTSSRRKRSIPTLPGRTADASGAPRKPTRTTSGSRQSIQASIVDSSNARVPHRSKSKESQESSQKTVVETDRSSLSRRTSSRRHDQEVRKGRQVRRQRDRQSSQVSVSDCTVEDRPSRKKVSRSLSQDTKESRRSSSSSKAQTKKRSHSQDSKSYRRLSTKIQQLYGSTSSRKQQQHQCQADHNSLAPVRSKSATKSARGTRTRPRLMPTLSSSKRNSRRALTPSSSFSSNLSQMLPGRSQSGRRHSSGLATIDNDELNVFASNMVSKESILQHIDDAIENQNVVKIEFEDLMERRSTEIIEIAEAINVLLLADSRPWECLRFVNDILVASPRTYKKYYSHKRQFWRALGTVCKDKVIPVQFEAKVTLISESVEDSIQVERVLKDMQRDKSVTTLHVNTKHTTQSIIEDLTELFECDDREWSSVTLDLSGEGPSAADTTKHKAWCRDMLAAIEDMELVAKERGIVLSSRKLE